MCRTRRHRQSGQQGPRREEILAGSGVEIRIEPAPLMFFDMDTCELLRARPNPLSADKIAKLRVRRPAGPPPRPATELVRVHDSGRHGYGPGSGAGVARKEGLLTTA